MNPGGKGARSGKKSIPRVSGDEPSWLATVPDDMEYSPRERG